MKLTHITLKTSKLKELEHFYGQLLNMPILERKETAFTLFVGDSTLTFEMSEEDAHYHVAFCVNYKKYDKLIDKMTSITPKLRDIDGKNRFMSDIWQREQIYYYDPAGNNIELLPDINQEKRRCGDHYTWSHIQEIGIPVRDVSMFKKEINFIKSDFQSESDQFAFHGDKDGVFVLVKEDREWFPTKKKSVIFPISIEIEEKIEDYQNVTHPYVIKTKKNA